MTIARRLTLLVALPLLVLIALGIFSGIQLARIEVNSRFLSETQVQSLAVLGDISRSFAEMRVNLRSFILAEDKERRARSESLYREDKGQLEKDLAHYGDSLISDEKDRRLLSDFRTLSREWISEAERLMSVTVAGQRQQAVSEVVSGALQQLGARVGSLSTEWIKHNERLADDAGRASLEAIDRAQGNLLISVGGSLLLTGILGFFTFRRIVKPIRALQGSVEAIATGDYAKRVPFTEAKDETGGLARSIDVLKKGAAAMEEQRWIKANTARLMEKLQGASSHAEFGERLLSEFVPMVGGGAGAFYLVDQGGERLHHVAGYGLDASATPAESFRLGEGLVGQCARVRAATTVTDLPPSYLRITSGVGGAAPLQTCAWPVMSRQALLGVLEIASFRAFNTSEQALLEAGLPGVAMSLEILSRNLATQELLAQTQEQARQLEEQTEELTQSQEELLAQKEELLAQKGELTAQREQLKESEERSRLILESSSEGIFGTDPDGRITFVNPAACQMLGFTPEELLGHPSHATFHNRRPDGTHYPKEECPMFAAYTYGKASRIDDEFLWRKDGTGLPVEYGATPVLKDGTLVGSVVSFTDITDRKLAEQHLRETEQFFRSVLELAPDGLMVVDAKGTIQLANAQCEKLFGYTRDELIGQSVEMLVPTEVRDAHPALREAYHRSPVTREMGSGGELRGRRKDGSLFPVEIGLSPLPGRQSGGMQVAVSIRDITERKRAEADLQQRKEELQRINFQADTALELTKAGYWHVPLDGSGWYNSSERAVRLFGDPPTPDFRYTIAHWAEHVRLGDEAAAKITAENFQAAAEGKIPVYDATYAYKRPVDEHVVWIHALGHVVKDQDGKPTDMFGVTQDISDFKLLETQLVAARQKAEEATQAKSMFLANMSHEIRTPMNAIIGMTHLALKTDLTPKQRDYLVKVRTAAGTLLGIINDILDFSKIEAGKLDIESADFRFEDVLENLSTVVGHKAQEKNLEFLISTQPGIPPSLVGDPLRLGQVLVNLVNNAVKFTEQGEVIVSVGVEEQVSDRVKLRFSVRDTGIGMTPAQLENLFQAFTQADTSTTRKFGGTGLGLSISKRLVEMMGGTIWAESEAGAGSTFHFTAWFGVGAAEQGRKRFVPDLAGIRALVVDDNAQAREILSDTLRGFALRVDAVPSGQDAIRALAAADSGDPYQLVLMDWHMPEMDGLEASTIIRREGRLRNIPRIVMVTAFGREEVRAQAEQIGVDGYLLKPVNASVLYDTLMEFFGAAGLETAAPDHHRKGAAPEYDARGTRVLLVEDNEMNQQVATELLESAGAAVTIAEHGAAAVKLLREGPHPPPFDIVLMDLQMPEMDGFTATRLLRADLRFENLPIIAMTAHALVEERQRCLEAGMNDHITKPIDPDTLFAALARWTAKREAAPPSAKSSARPVGGPEVPEIDGIDVAGGLKRVAGNMRLYRNLLEQFAAKQADAAPRIAEALKNGDRALAGRYAHTLKGVAGNIGIRLAEAVAARLEKAIREEGAAVPVLLTELESALAGQVRAIRAVLGESAPEAAAGAFDAAVATAAVARLKALIEASDGDAADAVRQVAEALAGKVDTARLAALRDSVEQFDFDGALAQLSEIARECNLSLG